MIMLPVCIACAYSTLAMSFNAPFTTMEYYAWLFDKDSNDIVTPTNLSQQLQESSARPSIHRNASLDGDSYSNCLPISLDHTFSENIHIPDGNLEIPSDDVPTILATMHMQTEANGLFNPQPRNPGFVSSHIYQASNGYLPTAPTRSSTGTTQSSPFNDDPYGTPNTRIPSIPQAPMVSHKSQAQPQLPPDAYPTKEETTTFPKITQEARDGLIELISQSHPSKPNNTPITASEPLLTTTSLQNYSDLFFTRFNSSYPLIHQATFDPSNIHPFLLLAVLLLGATYSDKESHLLAVCLHDVMRPLIHSSKEFGTRPRLWMLQTILLVECFGKSRAGERQHDMSHLYHGLLIK